MTDPLAALEAARWPDGPACPFCGSAQRSRKRDAAQPGRSGSRWQCQPCGRPYSATSGTSIAGARRLDVIRDLVEAELAGRRVNLARLARAAGIRAASATRMRQRVRAALAGPDRDLLTRWIGQ